MKTRYDILCYLYVNGALSLAKAAHGITLFKTILFVLLNAPNYPYIRVHNMNLR